MTGDLVTTLPGFELTTPRLRLRPLKASDADALHAYRNDPGVARFQSWTLPYSCEQVAAMTLEMAGRTPGDPGWVQIALEEVASGTLLGDLALNTDEQRQQAEIGFTLAAASQGQGYAAEAVRALLAHAFGTLQFHRVHASIDPCNTAAARLLTRLNFRHEGTALESYPHRGEWTDDARYALLRREWNP